MKTEQTQITQKTSEQDISLTFSEVTKFMNLVKEWRQKLNPHEESYHGQVYGKDSSVQTIPFTVEVKKTTTPFDYLNPSPRAGVIYSVNVIADYDGITPKTIGSFEGRALYLAETLFDEAKGKYDDSRKLLESKAREGQRISLEYAVSQARKIISGGSSQ